MINKELLDYLNIYISKASNLDIKIMEVCGTHTRAIAKSGIKQLLTENISLLSGPGCPVCVTDDSYINLLMEISRDKNIILVSFGDIINYRIKENSQNNIRIAYSPKEALNIAIQNKDKLIVFAAFGFETTAPIIASLVIEAQSKNINNITFFTALKVMEPVLRYILDNKSNKISALILPGHVATVTGSNHFNFVSEDYNIPSVICGFESLDIISGITMLLKEIIEKDFKLYNLYQRCVRKEGNRKALSIMNKVFEKAEGIWRGIGAIEQSALIIRQEYDEYNAMKRLGIQLKNDESYECKCSEILLGSKTPKQCVFFGKECTPDKPIGPCMVTSEGACAAYYKYGDLYGR